MDTLTTVAINRQFKNDAVVEQVAVPGCPWKIEITADFSFKGGPSNCKGVFKIEHGTILWNKGLNGSEAVTWTKQ